MSFTLELFGARSYEIGYNLFLEITGLAICLKPFTILTKNSTFKTVSPSLFDANICFDESYHRLICLNHGSYISSGNSGIHINNGISSKPDAIWLSAFFFSELKSNYWSVLLFSLLLSEVPICSVLTLYKTNLSLSLPNYQ